MQIATTVYSDLFSTGRTHANCTTWNSETKQNVGVSTSFKSSFCESPQNTCEQQTELQSLRVGRMLKVQSFIREALQGTRGSTQYGLKLSSHSIYTKPGYHSPQEGSAACLQRCTKDHLMLGQYMFDQQMSRSIWLLHCLIPRLLLRLSHAS